MKRLWRAIQCRFFSNHRWQEIRVDGEKAFQCRDCGKRYFGDDPTGEHLYGQGGAGGAGPG